MVNTAGTLRTNVPSAIRPLPLFAYYVRMRRNGTTSPPHLCLPLVLTGGRTAYLGYLPASIANILSGNGMA